MDGPQPWPAPPEPTRLGHIPWLEHYPDLLLDQMPGTARTAVAVAAKSVCQMAELHCQPAREGSP
jgi:hypothetical protein